MLVEELKNVALSLLEREEVRPEYESLADYALGPAKDRFFLELMTSPDEVVTNLRKLSDMGFRDNLASFIDLLFIEIGRKVFNDIILDARFKIACIQFCN